MRMCGVLWIVTSSSARKSVRSPEDACTQHVGNHPPVVLAELKDRNLEEMAGTPWNPGGLTVD